MLDKITDFAEFEQSFSFVTCGFYSIYWFIAMTDEINALSENKNDTSGGMAFLLTLVTCGIYAYYWAYKMGDKLDAINQKNESKGIIYLLLSIFGFSIIAYALIQDSINKLASSNEQPPQQNP